MFKSLCSKHNFNSKNDISHVLMDGGVLSVPFDRLNIFYDICIQCIKSGEHIFVVEQKTNIYNFFIDIDYKDDEALTLEQIKQFSQTIFSKIKSFSGAEQTCIVSVAKPKLKDGKIKSGVHMNFPKMLVDQHRAIQLMYHLIHTLSEIYPYIDWPKFIDPAVYGKLDSGSNGSGFRMPWSHKKSKHDDCKGNGCDVCNRSGKITEVSYLPVFLLEKHSITELPIQDPPMKELLELTTIRSDKTLADCITVPDAIEQATVINKSKFKKEREFTAAQSKQIITDETLRQKIEMFVNKHMKGQENTKIKKILKWKDHFLIEADSKFCENLNRNHSSNRIYFFVHGIHKTICQKCFCTCETTEGRRHGFCKDFSGRVNQLPPQICEIMFINNKNIKSWNTKKHF